jgi:hypothetical protein
LKNNSQQVYKLAVFIAARWWLNADRLNNKLSQ